MGHKKTIADVLRATKPASRKYKRKYATDAESQAARNKGFIKQATIGLRIAKMKRGERRETVARLAAAEKLMVCHELSKPRREWSEDDKGYIMLGAKRHVVTVVSVHPGSIEVRGRGVPVGMRVSPDLLKELEE